MKELYKNIKFVWKYSKSEKILKNTYINIQYKLEAEGIGNDKFRRYKGNI